MNIKEIRPETVEVFSLKWEKPSSISDFVLSDTES